jgi:hypothetical protein
MARVVRSEGAAKKARRRGGKARLVAEVGPLPVALAAVEAADADAVQPLSVEDESTAGLAVMESGGLSPLAYLLRVMRDEQETPARRMDAAKTAAPFLHPKLATMDVQSAGLDRMGDALVELIERAQADGGGVSGLLGR